jgi:hypothetical protein
MQIRASSCCSEDSAAGVIASRRFLLSLDEELDGFKQKKQ